MIFEFHGNVIETKFINKIIGIRLDFDGVLKFDPSAYINCILISNICGSSSISWKDISLIISFCNQSKLSHRVVRLRCFSGKEISDSWNKLLFRFHLSDDWYNRFDSWNNACILKNIQKRQNIHWNNCCSSKIIW